MMIMKKILTLYLVFILVSFIGFIYETILAVIIELENIDRGFLTLPLCPIYGFGVILTYLILDIPINIKLFKYRFNVNRRIKFYLYFLLSALFASILEIIVGYSFEYLFDKVLWEYSGMILSFNKYCSLFPSICWGIVITLFMHNIFPYLYNRIIRINFEIKISFSIAITIFIFIDLLSIFLKS